MEFWKGIVIGLGEDGQFWVWYLLIGYKVLFFLGVFIFLFYIQNSVSVVKV